jgi:hypothetical protein
MDEKEKHKIGTEQHSTTSMNKLFEAVHCVEMEYFEPKSKHWKQLNSINEC